MTDDKDLANYALLSGLLLGCVSALKDPNELARVKKDMMDYSKKLAKLGGVVLKRS